MAQHCRMDGALPYHHYSAPPTGGAAVEDERRYLAILNDHAQHWPGLCCWWCTNEIPKDRQPLPLAMHQRRVVRTSRSSFRRTSGYQWHGFFCCVACVKAFCVSRQVPFSPTRMFLAEIGAMPWHLPPVRPANNYLDQKKFGPGAFRTSSHKYRMQTVCLMSPPHRPLSSRVRTAPQQQTSTDRAWATLRRKRRRHSGDGTLMQWLGGKE